MQCMVPACEKEATTICPDRFDAGSRRLELHFCKEDYAQHYFFDHVQQSAETPPGPSSGMAVFDGKNSYQEWVDRRGPFEDMAR